VCGFSDLVSNLISVVKESHKTKKGKYFDDATLTVRIACVVGRSVSPGQ